MLHAIIVFIAAIFLDLLHFVRFAVNRIVVFPFYLIPVTKIHYLLLHALMPCNNVISRDYRL